MDKHMSIVGKMKRRMKQMLDVTEKYAVEDIFETIREEVWLEEVFGAQSRLESDAWVDKVKGTANWIFDATATRRKIFAEAKITIKH